MNPKGIILFFFLAFFGEKITQIHASDAREQEIKQNFLQSIIIQPPTFEKNSPDYPKKFFWEGYKDQSTTTNVPERYNVSYIATKEFLTRVQQLDLADLNISHPLNKNQPIWLEISLSEIERLLPYQAFAKVKDIDQALDLLNDTIHGIVMGDDGDEDIFFKNFLSKNFTKNQSLELFNQYQECCKTSSIQYFGLSFSKTIFQRSESMEILKFNLIKNIKYFSKLRVFAISTFFLDQIIKSEVLNKLLKDSLVVCQANDFMICGEDADRYILVKYFVEFMKEIISKRQERPLSYQPINNMFGLEIMTKIDGHD